MAFVVNEIDCVIGELNMNVNYLRAIGFYPSHGRQEKKFANFCSITDHESS